MVKALVLFSGGLDSVITVKLLQEQNIHVTALYIKNGFRIKDTTNYLIDLANKINVEIFFFYQEKEFFDMWKNPIFGYGKAVNPCINCHALMANIAEQYRIKYNYDFIATGDVLEQRGFSQTSIQLKKVISIIDNPDKILRPLSAKLLNETEMEKNKLVNRSKLLNISGKSRKIQFKLLKKYGLSKNEVENPAGGCLMAEYSFKNKVNNIIKKLDFNDFQLMKYGRHLNINNYKIILSRNAKEHKEMLKYNGNNYILLETNNIKSPIAYIEKKYFLYNNIYDIIKLLKKYSKFSTELNKINFTLNKNTIDRIINI